MFLNWRVGVNLFELIRNFVNLMPNQRAFFTIAIITPLCYIFLLVFGAVLIQGYVNVVTQLLPIEQSPVLLRLLLGC